MKIIPFSRSAAESQQQLGLLLLLLLMMSLQGQAAEIAYYSNGQNITTPAGSSNVSMALAAEAAQLQLAATVTTSISGPVAVRLPLSGIGQPGFRVGVLVSTANSPSLLSLSQLVQLRAVGTVTLRIYLGTALQQEQVVDVSVAQLALLAGAGQPTQLDFVSQVAFEQVEVTFGQALQVGVITKIHYVYAIGPDKPKRVKGFLSQFDQMAVKRYDTASPSGSGVCVNSGIDNPERAVDADLTNYASFSNLVSLGTGCGGTLRVQLAGTVPAAGPLSVVLTSFGVSRPAGNTAAEVVWATASEQHSAYFVVERAIDPQAGFQSVGQVVAAGTSAATHQYRLRDAAAPTGEVLYYRLRQVDLDGREQLSAVATLAAGIAEGFALYPNPANDGPVSLRLPASVAAGTTVAIYSALGQLLHQQFVGSEQQPAALATTGLLTGIYQVMLRDAAGQRLATKRLVLNR